MRNAIAMVRSGGVGRRVDAGVDQETGHETRVDVKGAQADVRGTCVDVRGTHVDVKGAQVGVKSAQADVVQCSDPERGRDLTRWCCYSSSGGILTTGLANTHPTQPYVDYIVKTVHG
eukprot:41294-Prorocentrum_minimum.AAC.4